MTIFASRFLVISMVVAFVSLAGWQADAETNRVKFPENLDQLVHYTTVRRGNVTEHILTTPEAMEAVKKDSRSRTARISCSLIIGMARSTDIS